MFADQNEALRRTSAAGGRGLSLWSIGNSSEAYEAARNGWFAAAWLCFGYTFGIVMLITRLGGFRLSAPVLFVATGVDAVFAALGAVLAGFLFFKQARWAGVVLVLWAGLEVLLKALSFFYAGMFALPGAVVDLVVLVVAVRSVRGAFALARFKRGTLTPAQATRVFD